MKIQTNRQTKDGVWGVMLSGWATPLTEPAECVFSRWLTQEEAAELAADLIVPGPLEPNGAAGPKETP